MISKYINLKDQQNINYERLKQPAEAMKEGKLVLFPTETVYGIGANALDEKACSKIFEAKGRKQDNPLIVHISDIDMLYTIVDQVRRNRAKIND